MIKEYHIKKNYFGFLLGKGYDKIITNTLKCEREYVNGEISGKMKEYHENGKLKFEGEYLNGIKIKGKELDDDGDLEFEGEYLNGNRWNGME